MAWSTFLGRSNDEKNSFFVANHFFRLQALATGALTALHTCYSDSIDGKPGVFLSDGLISSTKEIHGLISQGAYVYVCGGAKVSGKGSENL